MKKFLLTAAFAVSISGAAGAADLSVKAPRVTAPPVVQPNFSGCYVGGGGGYGMFSQDHRTRDLAGAAIPGVEEVTTGGRGWFGTVQVGCDYQFSDRFVFGAFADYDFADIGGRFSPALLAGAVTGRERIQSSWAAGGRLGFIVVPQVMAYVSGGFTEARFDSVNLTGAVVPPGTTLGMDEQTYQGWFIGTGYEYSIGFLPGLFWKTEYRFADYSRERPIIFATVGGVRADLALEDSRTYVQTIRSELVYRFNFGRY